MPKPGQMTETCSVIRWLKKEGETVAKGDVLLEIETDKAAMEVESFSSGTLLKILVREGETAPVQTTIGFIGTPGEALPAVAAPTIPAPVKPATSAPRVQAAARIPEVVPLPAPLTVTPPPVSPATFKISPRAERLAKASGIDPKPIPGTGPGGRVVEKDVKAYLEAKGYAQLRITAAAKAAAAREGIDVLSLEGTGEGGRIGMDDVRRALAERPKPMSRMRQVIAQRLTQSVTTAPHFFVTVSADMTGLAAWRSELKAGGVTVSFNDFLLKAVALTLKDFPEVNSTTDGRTIRWNSRIHLGMAVNIDAGLVVPVIRDAGELTLAELHERAAALAERARQGKLRPDEMSGSTFTISNMGMLDVENFTAIINPGESAILAVSSILPQPVARDGQVVVRSMMKMTLSADHRTLDGASAARFVNALKAKLEDLETWKNSTS